MDSQSKIDDLLTAARNGDKKTENQLFSLLRARILALVQQRIWNTQKPAGEIWQDAEDLTEDICLIILQKYKTETFDHGFLPWIFHIVRNKTGEYYRERDRKRRREDIGVDDESIQIVDSSARTDLPAESHELDKMIFHALEKMDGRGRAIIRALLQDEIKDYIAEQRQTTRIETIYGQISRCRTRFQKLLRHEGFEI